MLISQYQEDPSLWYLQKSGMEPDGIRWFVVPSTPDLEIAPDVSEALIPELLIGAQDQTGAQHYRTFRPTYGARYGLDASDIPEINKWLEAVIASAREVNAKLNTPIEAICRKALLGPLDNG